MKPIFVGNLEFESRQSDVERLFKRYGRVERIDMKSGNKMKIYNSSKKEKKKKQTKPLLEELVGGKVKVSSIKRKRMGSEIDDIFASAKKTKKLEVETNAKNYYKPSSDKGKSSKRTNIAVVKGKSVKNVKLDDLKGGQRKRTADGLPIYTMEELGMDEFGCYPI